ncbi:hypothetical protein DB30_07312 [Enhygromyxa salina]|uniref:Uncharacterized protein n=1 Tax=Enhygromyxa salina TaxID=215803 RepID=A0A0C2CWP6_9BACT|nr:hypothetical protein DB30_07312 [Enhygromyxa salina]
MAKAMDLTCARQRAPTVAVAFELYDIRESEDRTGNPGQDPGDHTAEAAVALDAPAHQPPIIARPTCVHVTHGEGLDATDRRGRRFGLGLGENPSGLWNPSFGVGGASEPEQTDKEGRTEGGGCGTLDHGEGAALSVSMTSTRSSVMSWTK